MPLADAGSRSAASMPLLRLVQPVVHPSAEPGMRLSRRELGSLRRWIDQSTDVRLSHLAVPDPLHPLNHDRRELGRRGCELTVELRPISACSIGLVRPATVRDVSWEGIALWTGEILGVGQRLSLEVRPPDGLPRRRFRRAEGPINLLAVVRYCRPEGDGFVAGCTIGVSWVDSLANQMFPADLAARRSA